MENQPDELPLILNSKVWIPDQLVADHDALDQFHKHLFHDHNCSKCPHRESRGKNPLRPAEACLGDGETHCPNYFGRFDLHVVKESQGVIFHGLPYGNRDALLEVFPGIYEYPHKDDRRPRPAFRWPIEFTGSLRDYQERAVSDCIFRNGNLISKPRTGKTVMATALICRTGLKTLVLGGQGEWLKGFMDHFVGSKRQAAMTNIPQLRLRLETQDGGERRKAKGRKKIDDIIGFPETIEDFERLDICLVTYQKLIEVTESGRERLDAIANMFGLVVVDEVDTANADQFSTVISRLNAAYKLGITATWDRKDGRQVLMEHLIGDILHQTETPMMTPKVVAFESMAHTSINNWSKYMKFLETDDTLFEEIIQNVMVDLENGHQILIPLQSVDHTIRVYKEINRRKEELVAAPILGSSHMKPAVRDKIVARVQSGELRVLVGPYQLVRRGVNFPLMSIIYEVLPSNNFPQAEQRLFRVLTPDPNKQQPVIKYFLVGNKIHASCIKSEYYGYVLPQLKPDISAATVAALKAYFDRLLPPRGEFGGARPKIRGNL